MSPIVFVIPVLVVVLIMAVTAYLRFRKGRFV